MPISMRACASRPRVLRAVNPASPSTRHLVARSSDNAQLQHESMEFLFEEYQSTSNAVLREEQTKGGRLFSLDFMRWLDEAEQNCDDPERKERLGALAGRIMSLRRGIVPTAELSADSISVDAAQQPKLDDTVPPEPWPTWPRQKRWEPEHEMQKQALVTALKSAVKEQRARAVTEITGRAPVQHLSNEDLEARLASVNAARRIAEFLVTVADSEERRTLLKEALTPPEPQAQNASSEAAPQVDKSMSDLLASLMDTMEGSEGSSLSDDAAFPKQQASDPGNKAVTQTPEDDISAANLTEREAASGSGESQSETEVVEDLLHTSPLQLLQAVKELIAELESKSDGSDGEERSESVSAQQQMPQNNAYEELPMKVAKERLQELKADALQAWNDMF